uniref:Uncharacterized protein n=1 Tax=Anguilla anguilla TaxID=7936 RepID=A0A0E9RJB2_ANGAN
MLSIQLFNVPNFSEKMKVGYVAGAVSLKFLTHNFYNYNGHNYSSPPESLHQHDCN